MKKIKWVIILFKFIINLIIKFIIIILFYLKLWKKKEKNKNIIKKKDKYILYKFNLNNEKLKKKIKIFN